MGELDDVEHAEEQREAHGDQAVHDAEHEPVDQILKRDLHAVISDISGGQRWLEPFGARRCPCYARRARLTSLSLRLPEAYSLSSQITHLPSWTTYLEISGTVFCPWSSNVTAPDNGIVVRDLAECVGDLLAIGSDLFDRIEDQLHRDEREGAVGLRRLLVAGLVVLLLEKLSARELLDRGALDETERAFRQRAQRLDIGVGLDAGGALEHRVEADLVHLRANADSDRGQAAEVDDFGIERLCLREFGGEILLVGGDAEGAEDLAAVLP